MAKKAAVRLWHRARDFDRGTHQPGRHGGAVRPPQEPPAPASGTWGEPTPMPCVLAQAAQEAAGGGEVRAVVNILASAPGEALAAALACLGRAFMARDS